MHPYQASGSASIVAVVHARKGHHAQSGITRFDTGGKPLQGGIARVHQKFCRS